MFNSILNSKGKADCISEMPLNDRLDYGKEAEEKVADIIQKTGQAVLPLYQFDCDTWPFIMINDKKHVCPDLICLGSDGPYLIEVKRKQRWSMYNGKKTVAVKSKSLDFSRGLKQKTGVKIFYCFVIFGGTDINCPFDDDSEIYFQEVGSLSGRSWMGKDDMMISFNKDDLFDLSANFNNM